MCIIAVRIMLIYNILLYFVPQEHRNLPFMRELRYLFSLLVSSKRKYVDPSRAVEILKDAFKSNDSQQVSTYLVLCNVLRMCKKSFGNF